MIVGPSWVVQSRRDGCARRSILGTQRAADRGSAIEEDPMSASTEQVISGLEGVLACESAITFLDGLADPSVLEYRGYNIHDIAETTSFEEIAFLVIEGRLPNKAELAAFDQELKASRAIDLMIVEAAERLPKDIHPMAGFRTLVSLLGTLDPQQEDNSKEANRAKAVRMTAQFATIVAAQHRI